MPEYSGVAAVVPRGQPVEPPAGDQVMQFAERMLAIKGAQKQQALAQFQGVVKMASEAGFMFDPKMVAKLAKKAGLPISFKDEDLAAGVLANKTANMGKPDDRTGAIQQMTDVQNKNVDAQQQAKNTAPGDRVGMWVNQMAARAQKMINMNAQTDEIKARNVQQVESLKSQAMAGDQGAVGKLIGLNEWHFDLNYEKWSKMDDKQKQGAFNIMAGMESEADKTNRATKLSESLMSSGKVSDPSAAMKIGTILVNGGQIPPELKSQMKAFTFGELTEQAQMAQTLGQMGVPGDKIGSTMRAAAAGGLENALPKGLKSLAQQSLDIQQKELGIEQAKAKREIDIAEKQLLLAEAKAHTEGEKAALDDFKSLVEVEVKKAGGKVDDEILKAAQAKLADKFNLDVTLTKKWFDYVTGEATHMELTPRLTDTGRDTVHKLAGRDKPKVQPGVLDSLVKAANKEPI